MRKTQSKKNKNNKTRKINKSIRKKNICEKISTYEIKRLKKLIENIKK